MEILHLNNIAPQHDFLGSKETPTCLVIFLILRKLKTKPNGPLGSSTQAELTIVSTSQTKHLIL